MIAEEYIDFKRKRSTGTHFWLECSRTDAAMDAENHTIARSNQRDLIAGAQLKTASNRYWDRNPPPGVNTSVSDYVGRAGHRA